MQHPHGVEALGHLGQSFRIGGPRATDSKMYLGKVFSVEEKQKNAREEPPCSISKHDTILLPVTVTSSLASHLHLLPETRDLK